MSDIRRCVHGRLIAPAPEEMRCPQGCTREASEAEIVDAVLRKRSQQEQAEQPKCPGCGRPFDGRVCVCGAARSHRA